MQREQVSSRFAPRFYHPLNLAFQRYLVREFHFSEESLLKEREDLVTADTTEKELWVCSLSFIPTSETHQLHKDRAPAIVTDEFLRILSDPRPP